MDGLRGRIPRRTPRRHMSAAVGHTAAVRGTGGAGDAQPGHPPHPRLAFRVQPPTLPCRGGVRQPLLACPGEMRLPPPTRHAGAATPQRTSCRAAAAVDGRQPPSPRLTRHHGRHTHHKRHTHALSRHRYITNTHTHNTHNAHITQTLAQTHAAHSRTTNKLRHGTAPRATSTTTSRPPCSAQPPTPWPACPLRLHTVPCTRGNAHDGAGRQKGE